LVGLVGRSITGYRAFLARRSGRVRCNPCAEVVCVGQGVICFLGLWRLGGLKHGVSRVWSNEPFVAGWKARTLGEYVQPRSPMHLRARIPMLSTIDALVCLIPLEEEVQTPPSNRQSWRHSPAPLLNNTHLSLRAFPTIGLGGGARWGVWGEESEVPNF